MGKRARRQRATQADLVARIEAHGYTVVFVDYCEDGETPGIIGQFAGLTDHQRRKVKISTKDRMPRQVTAILAHELEHVEGAEYGSDHPELGLHCGGRVTTWLSSSSTSF